MDFEMVFQVGRVIASQKVFVPAHLTVIIHRQARTDNLNSPMFAGVLQPVQPHQVNHFGA